MAYVVTSTINDDLEVFEHLDEVDEYMDTELELANVNEIKNPYTKSEDFTVDEIEFIWNHDINNEIWSSKVSGEKYLIPWDSETRESRFDKATKLK